MAYKLATRKQKKRIKLVTSIFSTTFKEQYDNLYYELNKHCIKIANSLVYLDNPDRNILIKWWNKYYPDSIEAKVICKQNFFKRIPKHYTNYIKHCNKTKQKIKY